MAEYIEREATCGDCLHADVCESNPLLTEFSRENPAYCVNFVDAADVVERKRGEWIKVGESCGADILECPVCHTIHPQYGDAFCRDCGADMRGESDANDHESP